MEELFSLPSNLDDCTLEHLYNLAEKLEDQRIDILEFGNYDLADYNQVVTLQNKIRTAIQKRERSF